MATRAPRQCCDGHSSGRLHAGSLVIPCALGRAGVRHRKREGDLATPAGNFQLLSGFFRTDKTCRRAWPIPMRPLRTSDGWCDDPSSATYNRRINLPNLARHEKLWREDGVYDFILVLNYNLRPRRKYRGSAIFLHCARPGFEPTEGCIALNRDDLRRLLPRLAKGAVISVRQ
ncbi:MAG TPA: L,D-transpeptidase family protein [Methylocella sp.]|nr:L,D-transpeptidase family protein [Methylocella sp.]